MNLSANLKGRKFLIGLVNEQMALKSIDLCDQARYIHVLRSLCAGDSYWLKLVRCPKSQLISVFQCLYLRSQYYASIKDLSWISLESGGRGGGGKWGGSVQPLLAPAAQMICSTLNRGPILLNRGRIKLYIRFSELSTEH